MTETRSLSVSEYEARQRARRAAEKLLFPKKTDAPRRVCLVYPNRYPLALGNLGFQTVFEIVDRSDGFVCERAFLPENDELAAVTRTGLRSFESFRPLADFDIVAFSISFESDYLNLPRLLRLAGLEARREHRQGPRPLVLGGGPAIFLNPDPVAEFFDLFLIGEAEEMLPEFLALHSEFPPRGTDPGPLLEAAAARIPGAYVPAFFSPVYDGPVQVDLHVHGPGDGRVERRLVWDLNRFSTTTRVLSDAAVFGDMVMVEASRGCQWGCRFCAAGYMYRPIRSRNPDRLADDLTAGLEERSTIGLVGAEMASVAGVADLARLARQGGGRLSPSSMKADCVTVDLASALAGGGTRSATVAPEAGSERMRRVINKNLSEVDILRAADLLVGEGVQDLKCYFMFGLPTETADDLRSIVDLVDRLRGRLCEAGRPRGRVGRVTVSLNPFVPKPWTPFQWDPMEPIATLRRRTQYLRKELGRLPNTRLDADSPREGFLQTLLSRGDRRIATFLEAVEDAGGDWWRTIREWERRGLADLPPPESYVYRPYTYGERLPWDFIHHRIEKQYLWIERRKALAGVQTAPCDTSTCHACAAC